MKSKQTYRKSDFAIWETFHILLEHIWSQKNVHYDVHPYELTVVGADYEHSKSLGVTYSTERGGEVP